MNILVTGANGMLGSSVMTELRRRGHHGIAVGRAPQCRSTDAAAYVQANLCDASAVQALFAGVQPDAVIHCAAWTDVDGAELPENPRAGVCPSTATVRKTWPRPAVTTAASCCM